jgi:FAD-dependent urate hydroxylase
MDPRAVTVEKLGPLVSWLHAYHAIGPAGISRLVSMPYVLRAMPRSWRDKLRVRAVRPAGSAWLPARLASVKVSTGRMVTEARAIGNEVRMKLDDGTERSAQHVLMGTGYAVDIGKYEFMSPELLKMVQMFNGYPVLAPGFCSSMPGLHFIGATAARSFGPLLYFVAGTEFASRDLTSYIVRDRKKNLSAAAFPLTDDRKSLDADDTAAA